MRKIVVNGYIVGISNDADEMTEEEIKQIKNAQSRMPEYVDGYVRKLRADTLEWEIVEVPTEEAEEQKNGYAENELLSMTNAELERILYGYGVSASMNKENLIRLILSLQGEN